MPILNIDGQLVDVDDAYNSLSLEQRAAEVEEIARSLGARRGGTLPAAELRGDWMAPEQPARVGPQYSGTAPMPQAMGGGAAGPNAPAPLPTAALPAVEFARDLGMGRGSTLPAAELRGEWETPRVGPQYPGTAPMPHVGSHAAGPVMPQSPDGLGETQRNRVHPLFRRARRRGPSNPRAHEWQELPPGILDSFTRGLLGDLAAKITAGEAASIGRGPDDGFFDVGNWEGGFIDGIPQRYHDALTAELEQQRRFGEKHPDADRLGETLGAAVRDALKIVIEHWLIGRLTGGIRSK